MGQDRGEQHYQHQQGEVDRLNQKDSNFQGRVTSESDWGSWEAQDHLHAENKDVKVSELKSKGTPPPITGIFQTVDSSGAEKVKRTPVSSTLDPAKDKLSYCQSDTSGVKKRLDSFTSDDFSSYSKVTDWSLEVEEEEEQQREQSHQQQVLLELATKNSQQQSSNHPHHTKPTDVSHLQHLTNQNPHSGGLIRLPPQHSSSSSASSNWRRDQIQHQGQQKQEANPRYIFGNDSQSNLIHDSDNPAWRGVPNPEVLQIQQQQQIAAAIAARAAANRPSGPQQQIGGPHPPRYLYDHKNPNKLIQVGASNHGVLAGDSSITTGARFALDPRFVHPSRGTVRHHNTSQDGSSHQPMAQQHPYAQAYHPITGQPIPPPVPQQNYPSSYRPPFPHVYGGNGPRNNASTGSAMAGPPSGTPQGAVLTSSQGVVEASSHDWQQRQQDQHSFINPHQQIVQMENKPDFDIIKYNEVALFEASKLITNDFLSQGGQKLRKLWYEDVTEARRNILSSFQRLLQTDLVFCAEKDVEFIIWKICFYNLVETLKTMVKHSEQSLAGVGGSGKTMGPSPPEIKSMVEDIIRNLLDEGLKFYSDMLDTLDKTYQIGLDKYYDVLEPRAPDTRMRCVLVSAQKCLLCLGDLARYKEQTQETSNYGKARQYYQKASHIDTRNGRPYNQLAILAYTTKRKLEAVYYNMRCLSSKSPILSS